MAQTRILIINPGSTTTDLAIFEGKTKIAETSLKHSLEELTKHASIIDQLNFRTVKVIEFLTGNPGKINYICARGGLLGPVESGVYEINKEMIKTLQEQPFGKHASNLGALIAKKISGNHPESKLLVADPPSVFEASPPITGHPKLDEKSHKRFHALNQKFVVEKVGEDLGFNPLTSDVIIIHLGGGTSIALHQNNKATQVTDALSEGPFTPNRAGSIQSLALLEVHAKNFEEEAKKSKITCNKKALNINARAMEKTQRMLVGNGGLSAYLNTTNFRKIEEMMINGDEHAIKIVNVMAEEIIETIGATATHSKNIKVIVFTGGLTKAKTLRELLTKKLSEGILKNIPIKFYPGAFEIEALARAALKVDGGLKPKQYVKPINF